MLNVVTCIIQSSLAPAPTKRSPMLKVAAGVAHWTITSTIIEVPAALKVPSALAQEVPGV
jgi:hypothetical protein